MFAFMPTGWEMRECGFDVKCKYRKSISPERVREGEEERGREWGREWNVPRCQVYFVLPFCALYLHPRDSSFCEMSTDDSIRPSRDLSLVVDTKSYKYMKNLRWGFHFVFSSKTFSHVVLFSEFPMRYFYTHKRIWKKCKVRFYEWIDIPLHVQLNSKVKEIWRIRHSEEASISWLHVNFWAAASREKTFMIEYTCQFHAIIFHVAGFEPATGILISRISDNSDREKHPVHRNMAWGSKISLGARVLQWQNVKKCLQLSFTPETIKSWINSSEFYFRMRKKKRNKHNILPQPPRDISTHFYDSVSLAPI